MCPHYSRAYKRPESLEVNQIVKNSSQTVFTIYLFVCTSFLNRMTSNSTQNNFLGGHGRGRGLLRWQDWAREHNYLNGHGRGRGLPTRIEKPLTRLRYDATVTGTILLKERRRAGQPSFEQRTTSTPTKDPAVTATTTRHECRPVWSVIPGEFDPLQPDPAPGMATTLQSNTTRVSINSNNTTEFT